MNNNEFFEDLLGLPHLKIKHLEQHPRKIIVHADLSCEVQNCPVCDSPTTQVNQYKSRKVQDLHISGKEVWLELRIKQLFCSICNSYFNEKVDWLLPNKSYTKRQAKWVFEMCAKQPFTEVGALLNIHAKKVERIYYEVAKQGLNLKQRYAQVRKLGIDEIAHRKGKKDFACVLVDLERNIQLDILPNRKKETLKAHFQSLGDKFCAQIEVVCCDIWKAYIHTAEELFPNVTVVIDRFHVVKALNDALDKQRKAVRRTQKEEEAFKRLKWKLFKRPEKCNKEEQAAINKALDKSPDLKAVYELRNQFNTLFDEATDKPSLLEKLALWINDVELLDNPYMNTFLKTLNNWKEQIASFAIERITNAATEGLNNYIRYFKRISFGIPNFEHMRLRILAAFV